VGLTPPTTYDIWKEIVSFLARHIKFTDPAQPGLISLWVMGTYCYKMFDKFAFLHLTGVTKACGKTTLLRMLAQICWNSTGIHASMTAANFYLEVENGKTICLDEFENMVKQEGGLSIQSTLNAGFDNQATVTRNYNVSRGMPLEKKIMRVYCPRVFASISQLPDTTAHRSFRIVLERKLAGDQYVVRFSERGDKQSIMALTYSLGFWQTLAGKVGRIYDTLIYPPELNGFESRLADMGAPLLAIAKLAQQEGSGDHMVVSLIEGLNLIKEDRGEDEQGMLVGILVELMRAFKHVENTRPISCMELTSAAAKLNMFMSVKRVGWNMKLLRIKRVRNMVGTYYDVSMRRLQELCAKYEAPHYPFDKIVADIIRERKI